MSFSFKITDVFECSLERAFKAPILGDATKFMKGYLFQPPVTGFEDDKTWGEVNGLRYPINNGNILVKKGRMFKDVILEDYLVTDYKISYDLSNQSKFYLNINNIFNNNYEKVFMYSSMGRTFNIGFNSTF